MRWAERRRGAVAEARAQQTYDRREDMLKEIVPLGTVGLTAEDIQVCLGCGVLVLRGWEDMHVARHAWAMATNPFAYLDVRSITDQLRRIKR